MKRRQPTRDGTSARATEIGPYRLGELLGRGGMGEVYRAYDDRLDRWVAVKRLRDRRTGTATSDRLRREAKVLARLGHPAIVQIFDIVEDDDQSWIVMELIEGPTLAELCRDQPIAVPMVTHYARQIASALGAAHDRGIVHRDLKTENVMTLSSGHVKVLDFGLAQEIATADEAEVVTHHGATVSLPGRLVGTPRSMSPEQVLGSDLDARSDLFSLGVLLYEIATGRSPFTAPTIEQMVQRVLRFEPQPLRDAAHGIPDGLSRLVHDLMEKDPVLRPASAEAVEEALTALDHPETAPTSVSVGLSQLATVDDTSWHGEIRRSESDAPAEPEPQRASRSASTVDEPTESTSTESRPSARPMRRRWAVALGLVVLLAVGIGVSRFLSSSAAEPRAVAVMASTVDVTDHDEALRLFAFTVRNATRRALVDLDGITARTSGEVDAVDAGPRAVAMAVAADEVVAIELACADTECLIELSRLGAEGELLAATQARAPRHRLLVATNAVHLAIRELYPHHPPSGRAEAPDVDAETYAEYVDLLHRLANRPDPEAMTALLDEVTQLRQRAPGFPAAALLEAEAMMQRYYQQRDPALLERVRQALDVARRLDPEDPEPIFEQIQLAIEEDALDTAEERLALAAEMVPHDVRPLELRAELLEARGRSEEALALRAEVVDRQPSWARLYRHAKAAFDQGDAATARQSLQRLLDRFPDNRWAISLLAKIELETGDFERAADLYTVLTERSAAANDLTSLGVVHLLRRDFDAAVERFEQALALRPGNLGDALNLADAHLLAGRRTLAAEHYRRILVMLAEQSDVGWEDEMLGAQAHAHLGARQEAVAAIQRAIRSAPAANVNLAFEAALTYVVVGDHTAALVNAEAARQLGRPEHWFELPWFDPIRSELAAIRDVDEVGTVSGHSTSE